MANWRKHLAELELEHANNESDVGAADRLWVALDGNPQNNLKSVLRTIKTFRGVAIETNAGIDRLAEALQEVFDLTGQLPTRSDVDDDLFWKISRVGRLSSSKATKWLIATLNHGEKWRVSV